VRFWNNANKGEGQIVKKIHTKFPNRQLYFYVKVCTPFPPTPRRLVTKVFGKTIA